MEKYKTYGRAGVVLYLAMLLGAATGGCDVSGNGAGIMKREPEKAKSIVIMTWNLQALFDGTEDGNEYDEYRKSAGWSREKYSGRLNAIAKAIEEMEAGTPDIIAVQEVESAQVLNDLAGSLSKHGYTWTHFANSPGMSLGLGVLSRFPLTETKVHAVNIDGSAAPRPVLETRVSAGLAPGAESLALFVCHWKSKLGGEDLTEAARRASARIILRRMRELAEQEPELPVIIMGDLNENHDEFYRRNGAVISALLPDDPRSAELTRLYAVDETETTAAAIIGALQMDFLILCKNKPPLVRYFPPQVVALYSPWTQELQNGSYYYRNEWETIDHFLLSGQLFNGTGWEFADSATANYQPFTNPSGQPSAYNPRTGSGLSDHLPLLLILKYQGP